MSEGIAKDLIKSDKRSIFPLFSFSWLTFALFEVKTGLGSITVATDNHDMPVYIGFVMVTVWLVMLYIPPPERRKPVRRDFNLSFVTRNLADRIKGNITHGEHSDWMLFTDAQKLPTEHHDLGSDRKNETLNGLQLDLACGAGILESATNGEGKTLLRKRLIE